VGTWLDTQPTAMIRPALTPSRRQRVTKGGEPRLGPWLELVDLHLDQLRVERSQLEWDWRLAYDDGWSPHAAAFAAWAKHLRYVPLPGEGP
jgi:hypothetical protein